MMSAVSSGLREEVYGGEDSQSKHTSCSMSDILLESPRNQTCSTTFFLEEQSEEVVFHQQVFLQMEEQKEVLG